MPAKKTKAKRKNFSPAQIAAQRAFAERNRGRKGAAGGGGGIRPDRGRGDPTPSRAEPAPLGAAFTMKVHTVPVVRTDPRDTIAMGTSLLFAMRSASAGLRDPAAAEAQEILAGWFRDAALSEILPSGVNLTDEVRFWHEVFRVMPQIANRMTFSTEEWFNAWNAIFGEALGSIPSGPPTVAGLDGIYPPVRGTVEDTFNPPLSPGVRIAAAAGTPVIAPEDLMITNIRNDGGSLGQNIVAVTRNPEDGSYPRLIGAGGTLESIMPHEGMRRHTFAGLGTYAAGLKKGDRVERGAQIATVGASGRGLEWRVALWVSDRDGKIKLTPMDPGDLVGLDVMNGAAAVRPPSPSWTIADPKSPSKTMEVPSTNIWIGGDLIHKGGKIGIDTGDIDVLNNPIGDKPSEFSELETVSKIGRRVLELGGTAVGGLYGGPAGAALGKQAGKGLGKIGSDLLGDAVGGGKQR